jgi:hypothetical protein
MDGAQKAWARSLCDYESEFLWQQDVDEVVHEDDYDKIKLLTKRFPKDTDLLHLPVIELWSGDDEVTGRRHCWKWRLSRNKMEITHGINKYAKLVDEKTGKPYARQGMSDGCEYINIMDGEPIKHKGFYSGQIEAVRVNAPEQYGEGINAVFNQLPSVFHYSWFNLENKIKQLKSGGVWDKMWALLYQEDAKDRFPEVKTEEDVKALAKKLHELGGEDTDEVKYKFKLDREHPSVIKEWVEENRISYE